MWFEGDDDADLFVKYLFTSQRLSIQVHPDNRAARARGLARGKDEAWFILEADPGAVIGLGPKSGISKTALRAAAISGEIERLLNWRPVAAGDVIYSPAGTIHAIGAGLSLVEIQQNLDLTYRLYDYGRPRELHVDEAVAVAHRTPHVDHFTPRELAPGRTLAAAGAAFALERWQGRRTGRIHPADAKEILLVPLGGASSADGEALAPGTVWSVRGSAGFSSGPDADLLVAYPGPPREAAFS